MPTSYPGALDTFTDPLATDLLSSGSVPHHAQHDNANDAIAAIQARLGTTSTNATLFGLVLTNGLDLSGSPTGYNGGELRFPTTTSGAAIGISTFATGAPSMLFDHRGASNGGVWYWRNGTGASVTQMSLDGSGRLSAVGPISGFGAGALGGTGNYVGIGDNGDASNVLLQALGSAGSIGVFYRIKGAGNHNFQDASGNQRFTVNAAAPTSGQASIQVTYHNGTSVTTQQATLGAADSGGTGFKLLRVPN